VSAFGYPQGGDVEQTNVAGEYEREEKTMISLKTKLVVLSATALFTTSAVAEMPKTSDGFPERPITMIVPFGAGGGSDQVARAMATAIESVSDASVMVVNKPGGGGLSAVPDFMAAPNDGYTVFMHLDMAVASHAAGDLDLNPGKDWQPLGIAQLTFSQLYVRSDETRFSNWQELVGYAQENPGQVTLANVGAATTMEGVNLQLLEESAGIDFRVVAFDKPSERYASLVGGHVDVLLEQPGDIRPFLDGGQMKPVLTLLQDRPAAFSDVPSLADLGADFVPLMRYRGFFTHRDAPEERLSWLAEAVRQGFETEAFQEFNKKKFMDVVQSYRSPSDAETLIDESITTYKAVFQKLN